MPMCGHPVENKHVQRYYFTIHVFTQGNKFATKRSTGYSHFLPNVRSEQAVAVCKNGTQREPAASGEEG